MSQRELIEPNKGDKRYVRRNEDGTFKESDDVSRSLSQDVRRKASTKKPKNEGIGGIRQSHQSGTSMRVPVEWPRPARYRRRHASLLVSNADGHSF